MAEPEYTKGDGDIYGKGACILHTLRYLIGEEAFFRALRRMAYPTKKMEKLTDGKQTRLVTTDDFKTIAEEESGMKLDWFFEVYLRQPILPKLKVEQVENNQGRISLNLKWETPNDMPFEMPIEVKVGDRIEKVKVTNNFGWMLLLRGEEVTIDPNRQILKAQE
jgi:aminopeptidase N